MQAAPAPLAKLVLMQCKTTEIRQSTQNGCTKQRVFSLIKADFINCFCNLLCTSMVLQIWTSYLNGKEKSTVKIFSSGSGSADTPLRLLQLQYQRDLYQKNRCSHERVPIFPLLINSQIFLPCPSLFCKKYNICNNPWITAVASGGASCARHGVGPALHPAVTIKREHKLQFKSEKKTLFHQQKSSILLFEIKKQLKRAGARL